MIRYLLAAEADKIQDFLFRSSKLREVVGGSQLLTRFCDEAALHLLEKYGLPKEDIITADGGGFRILFDDYDKAESFGRIGEWLKSCRQRENYECKNKTQHTAGQRKR